MAAWALSYCTRCSLLICCFLFLFILSSFHCIGFDNVSLVHLSLNKPTLHSQNLQEACILNGLKSCFSFLFFTHFYFPESHCDQWGKKVTHCQKKVPLEGDTTDPPSERLIVWPHPMCQGAKKQLMLLISIYYWGFFYDNYYNTAFVSTLKPGRRSNQGVKSGVSVASFCKCIDKLWFKKRKTKDDETAHKLGSCALIELIIYANNLKWPCGTKKKKRNDCTDGMLVVFPLRLETWHWMKVFYHFWHMKHHVMCLTHLILSFSAFLVFSFVSESAPQCWTLLQL